MCKHRECVIVQVSVPGLEHGDQILLVCIRGGDFPDLFLQLRVVGLRMAEPDADLIPFVMNIHFQFRLTLLCLSSIARPVFP